MEEKIKDILINGMYIFACDACDEKDQCLVSLKRSSNIIYKLNEIDRIAYKQIKINELNINLTELMRLLASK